MIAMLGIMGPAAYSYSNGVFMGELTRDFGLTKSLVLISPDVADGHLDLRRFGAVMGVRFVGAISAGIFQQSLVRRFAHEPAHLCAGIGFRGYLHHAGLARVSQ